MEDSEYREYLKSKEYDDLIDIKSSFDRGSNRMRYAMVLEEIAAREERSEVPWKASWRLTRDVYLSWVGRSILLTLPLGLVLGLAMVGARDLFGLDVQKSSLLIRIILLPVSGGIGLVALKASLTANLKGEQAPILPPIDPRDPTD